MSQPSNSSRIIGVKELRTHLDSYIDQVAKGKSFVVVKRSRPVFTISPPTTDSFGDDGDWETVVDFHRLPGGGIAPGELLSLLDDITT